MRAVIQRVTGSGVRVGGEQVARIAAGLLVCWASPTATRPGGGLPRRQDRQSARLRGRGRQDEPLAARDGRGDAGGQPVHPLRRLPQGLPPVFIAAAQPGRRTSSTSLRRGSAAAGSPCRPAVSRAICRWPWSTTARSRFCWTARANQVALSTCRPSPSHVTYQHSGRIMSRTSEELRGLGFVLRYALAFGVREPHLNIASASPFPAAMQRTLPPPCSPGHRPVPGDRGFRPVLARDSLGPPLQLPSAASAHPREYPHRAHSRCESHSQTDYPLRRLRNHLAASGKSQRHTPPILVRDTGRTGAVVPLPGGHSVPLRRGRVVPRHAAAAGAQEADPELGSTILLRLPDGAASPPPRDPASRPRHSVHDAQVVLRRGTALSAAFRYHFTACASFRDTPSPPRGNPRRNRRRHPPSAATRKNLAASALSCSTPRPSRRRSPDRNGGGVPLVAAVERLAASLGPGARPYR